MTDASGDGPRDPEVGSLAEETAKLLGALGSWARDEHVATGGPECQWCPVCRTVHAVRELSPEVKAHLAVAASSLAQAAAGFLATAAPSQDAPAPGVEKIDLDDQWEDD